MPFSFLLRLLNLFFQILSLFDATMSNIYNDLVNTEKGDIGYNPTNR